MIVVRPGGDTRQEDILETLKKDQTIWDIFTRKEEYSPTITDKYGRFPHYASTERSIFEPVVSAYLLKNGFGTSYPDNKKFAVCLTHDVDSVDGKKAVLMGRIAGLANKMKKGPGRVMRSYDPNMRLWRGLEEIITLEQENDAKSTFFFMVEDPGNEDFEYRIEELGEVICQVGDRGWEVGLHGGHDTYLSHAAIISRKKRMERVLGRAIQGYRNHYLRFKIPDTWVHLSEAGFKYDSTLGYSGCIGFRNGMCHPFMPFDLNRNSKIDIVEIPLIVMDRTILSTMNLDVKSAWNLTQKTIERVEKNQGVLTVLWHNASLLDENMKFYKKLLEFCREKDAWMTSGQEICANVHLVRKGETI